ncbi:hypothetical protein KIH39_21860 [Telmatocola sphagniphila]|uniref:4-O-methyl-glucuronoyl methylesterase-like domain-containing protein n=1 Tax=Telmatocola sphagniphila TaxID=1123043 RepID=A0A8E6EXN4_9BACT|nr:alpha/beta hydrolase family protein [Telmatocola sphagniphila]QVL31466.1 hypothetical protein KIH39_21860 [Telmatocola sphagniphila]
MKPLSLPLFGLLFVVFAARADDPSRVLPAGEKSTHQRTELVDLYKNYFPFTPPATKQEWEKRRDFVRTQVLVANGLYPLPEKTPLNPVVHGKVDREEYTVEKVYFASLPGHYVTGNLYRPKTRGKHPGVLCPHGHWADARLMVEPDAVAKKQIDSNAEKYMPNAKQFLQAKCAQLARMGCIVFHYDMVGSAESKAIPHREGFKDVQAELWQQNFMGLQTWNSIRCLDFLETLPDVDMKRIGVTGASGGGTQTFLLGAVDDRVSCIFPAVMVSTAMQGGCVCENCSLLRVNTGNIELAGIFAPKPMAMSGANDWTKEIETKGYPELKQLYKLYGAEEKVFARAWPEFPHNYNLHARELMYSWFSKYLLGKDEKIVEKEIVPVAPKDLMCFDAEHPRPKDETNADGVRKWFTEQSKKQLEKMEAKTRLAGLKALVCDQFPTKDELKVVKMFPEEKLADGTRVHKIIVGRKNEKDAIPCVGLVPVGYQGTGVIWVHPKGKASLFDEKGEPVAEVKALLAKQIAVMSFDSFLTGELASDKPYTVDKVYAGFTFGYNRSILANRVHDTLTALSLVKNMIQPKRVFLVGWESAGPQVVIARALAGDAVERTAADLNQFQFEKISAMNDANLLPGALKYGGLSGMLALCVSNELLVYNPSDANVTALAKDAYAAGKTEDLFVVKPEKPEKKDVLSWLTR